MRKADLINQISEKTGIPKVDVLVTLETMFKEVKASLAKGENIYIRGFGSFITKKRVAKIEPPKKKGTPQITPAVTSFNITNYLEEAKQKLPADKVISLSKLENNITRGDVKQQSVKSFTQIANFWKDSVKAFVPYAYYT